MSLAYDFAFKILPWITYTIFAVGIIDKIFKWLSGSPGAGALRRNVAKRISLALMEYLTHYRLLRKNVKLWLLTWPMMLSLAIVLFWHLFFRVIWRPIPSLAFIPIIFGIVLVVELALILVRQNLSSKPRSISTFSDNIAFLLVLTTALSGIAMALSPHTDEASIVSVPGISFYLEATPPMPLLIIHGILAQLTLMIAPFTKLIYPITGLIAGISRELSRGEIVSE